MLQAEIKKNIALYETHQQVFKSIDIGEVCKAEAYWYKDAIRDQHHNVKIYSDELKELNNSMEAAGWKNDKAEENILDRKIETAKHYYLEEKEKLDKLYHLQKEEEQRAAKYYRKNCFEELNTLNHHLLSLFEQYAQNNHDNNKSPSIKNDLKKEIKNDTHEEKYFSMKLVAAIYEQCNNEQFANATETDYYRFFNLQSPEKPLQIKEGERTRVYYLLHKMYECLPEPFRQNWRDTIFQQLAIDEKNYFSKYREPVSAMLSKKSKLFAQNMDDIFNQ